MPPPATTVYPAGDPARAPGKRPGLHRFGMLVIVVASVTAVAVGVVLRFSATSPLWLDEALSLNVARLGPGEIPSALRHDGHPPLYYFLLWAWTGVAGTGDAAVRALSGLIGLATLPLLWLAARRLAGPTAGWMAVILMATSPYAIRYGSEARMYALVMVLVLAGDLVLRRALRTGRPTALAGVALLTAAMALTHYWTLFLLAATAALLTVLAVTRHGPPRAHAVRAISAMAAGGLLTLPWLPALLFQLEHTGTPWATRPALSEVVRVTLVDVAGHRDLAGQVLKFGLLAAGAVALVVVGSRAWRRYGTRDRDSRDAPGGSGLGEVMVMAGTGAVALAALVLSDTAYATRYVSIVFPLVMVVLAVGLARLPLWLGAPAVAALAVLGLVGGWTTATTDRTQSADLGEEMARVAREGDVVVYCPDQLGPAFSREAPEVLAGVSYPAMDDPSFVDWVDYEERNAAADPVAFASAVLDRAGDHAVFMVWKTTYRTFEGQCEALDLEFRSARPGEVLEEPSGVFEPARLTWYPAP